MARSWTDLTFNLDGDESLLVTTHEETTMKVSLHCSGSHHKMDGTGFSIHFTYDHLPVLERLVKELNNMKTLDEQANIALAQEEMLAV